MAQDTQEQLTQQLAESGGMILPGEGTIASYRGETIWIKLRKEDTNGEWSLVEGIKPPMSAGPPLHVHTREDETFYILEGALRVQLGEHIFTARAGSIVYMPKGIPHTFCNPFNHPVRMLGINSPGGFERFFEDMAVLAAKAPSMTADEIAREQAELSARYQSTMVGPPLPLDPSYGL